MLADLLPSYWEKRAEELLEQYDASDNIDDKDDILAYLKDVDLAILDHIVTLAIKAKNND